MKQSIFLIIFLLACRMTMAQEGQEYVIKADTRPYDTFTFTDIYLYPSFIPAKVYFKTSRNGSGKMNYNRFSGEMDFIQGKDTLVLQDQATIKNIVIGDDVFYYQSEVGYVKRVTESEDVKLAKKEYLKLVDRRRHPNSATASSTGGTGSYNNLITTGGGVLSGLTLKMVEQEDLVYRKTIEFYFANAKGFFMKADKKNILKLYPQKKTELTAYIDENRVDFNSEEAMQSLYNFIAEAK